MYVYMYCTDEDECREGICIPHSIGENVRLLVDRPDGNYCFRLHKDRVYYVRYAEVMHC